MKIGDFYNFANQPYRILMFDEKEVFYQPINEDETFVYARNKTLSYFRTSRVYFDENSEFVKHSALTEREMEIHRSDLPLRLNCFSGLFWTEKRFENQIEFAKFLKSKKIDIDKIYGLNCSKVILFPTSQQQAKKKPILLKNKHGSILGKDLLLKCFDVQTEYVKPKKPYFSRYRLIPNGREEKRLTGIGLYRLGIKNNLPSYYLGGEISAMELDAEDKFIVSK